MHRVSLWCLSAYVSRFPVLQGDTSSYEILGILRLWCSSRVALLWRRMPSTAPFDGALHYWNWGSRPPKSLRDSVRDSSELLTTRPAPRVVSPKPVPAPPSTDCNFPAPWMSTSIGLNYRLRRPQGPGRPVHRVWTLKSHPATKRGGSKFKVTVQSPPLCLHRERRLRLSPTVVAGSSMDHHCTGTKKGKKVSGVRRKTGADCTTK